MDKIMQNRYSCRSYKDEKIDDTIIRDIINLTRLTPSSLGLEPWKFMVVKGKKLKELADICMGQKQVLNCSHAVIVISRSDLRSDDRFLQQRVESKGKTKEEAKAYILKRIASKIDNLQTSQIQHYASLQCYMATANLVNIAYSKNVKSCIIGGFDKKRLTQFIDLKECFEPCLVVTLGLSDELSTAKIRQNLDEVLLWVE